MGNLLGQKSSSINVMLIGLKAAGKTHFLYNGILEESWQDHYREGPENTEGTKKVPSNLKRQIDLKFDKKFVALEQTEGFNAEIISDRIDYMLWDIGGS